MDASCLGEAEDDGLEEGDQAKLSRPPTCAISTVVRALVDRWRRHDDGRLKKAGYGRGKVIRDCIMSGEALY